MKCTMVNTFLKSCFRSYLYYCFSKTVICHYIAVLIKHHTFKIYLTFFIYHTCKTKTTGHACSTIVVVILEKKIEFFLNTHFRLSS